MLANNAKRLVRWVFTIAKRTFCVRCSVTQLPDVLPWIQNAPTFAVPSDTRRVNRRR